MSSKLNDKLIKVIQSFCLILSAFNLKGYEGKGTMKLDGNKKKPKIRLLNDR